MFYILTKSRKVIVYHLKFVVVLKILYFLPTECSLEKRENNMLFIESIVTWDD
jgi:hypothetical protein